jgi:hypothetical protein
MTTSAWMLMLSVWAVILAATGYCFYKLLTSERQFGDSDDGS